MIASMRPIALVVAVVSACAANAMAHSGEKAANEGPLEIRHLDVSDSQRLALGIEVALPRATEHLLQPPLPGRVALSNEALHIVSARHDGIVERLNVAPGDTVVAGQEIAVLHSSTFLALQREFLDAVSQLELLRKTAERERRLSDEGIVAGKRARESDAQLREASLLADDRRQALQIAGATSAFISTLEQSRSMAPQLSIVSPATGDVLDQYMRPGDQAAAGAPLYRIAARSPLRIEVHTPVEIARDIPVGTVVEVVPDGIRGTVVSVAREVHQADQGVSVHAVLDSATDRLRPGQFVQVRFARSAGADRAFAVPARAVVRADERSFVFRQVDGGFMPIAVEIVGGSGSTVLITGDIDARAPVVVRGTSSLKAHWTSGGGSEE